MSGRILDVKPPRGVSAAPYPIWRDAVYRAAWTAIALAVMGLTVAGADGRPFWLVVGLGVAVATAGWMFFVWIPAWRWLVLAAAGVGALLLPVAPWPWSAGFFLAAASVMAAKEAHCFHFWSGRWLPWVALLAVVAAIAGVLPALTLGLWAGASVCAGGMAVQRWRLPWLRLTSEASEAAPGAPLPR